MQLWKKFTELTITKALRMAYGSKIHTVSAAGVVTEIDLNELAALNSIAAADLQKIDGITNGTAAAGKALVADTNVDISGMRHVGLTGTLTTGAIAGADAALDIDGIAAAQGGAVTVKGGTSSTAGNAGGEAKLQGGTPGSTSAGGNATVVAGAGGSASGAGGVGSVTGGAGTAGNSAGGVGKVVGGAGQGSAAGGDAQVTGGVGGATGAGGAVSITSGAGGATSGVSGDLTVATGTTTAGSGSATGAAILQSGAGAASAAAVAGGASGAVTLRSQAGGANTGGATGQVGGASGTVTVSSGAGGATNSTGAHAGGAGGNVSITGGAGGNATAGTGNGGKGASVILTPGAGGTSFGGTAGVAGGLFLRSAGGKVLRQQTALTQKADGNQSVTAAQLINGIVEHTVTTGRTLTTPTGAQISAEVGADLAVGDSFDFTLITIGTGADDISTLTAGDGNVTFVGVVTVGPNIAGTDTASATWRFRNTGADTWVGYRLT